jgi:hypothetical protein
MTQQPGCSTGLRAGHGRLAARRWRTLTAEGILPAMRHGQSTEDGLNRYRWLVVGACASILAVAGCGDPPTTDDRGFTKAPLEHIGVFIRAETRSDVRAFARLNVPDGQRIAPQAADSAAD